MSFINTFSSISRIATGWHAISGRGWGPPGPGPVAPIAVPLAGGPDNVAVTLAAVVGPRILREVVDRLQVVGGHQALHAVHLAQVEAVVVRLPLHEYYLTLAEA